jgi:serine/threonine protein kinase
VSKGREVTALMQQLVARSWRMVVALLLHLLAALRTVHSAGIAHLDVADRNLLLSAAGRLVLSDFDNAVVEVRACHACCRLLTPLSSKCAAAPTCAMHAACADNLVAGQAMHAVARGCPAGAYLCACKSGCEGAEAAHREQQRVCA